MVEEFIKSNWRTLMVIFLLLFAYLVYPTPFAYWTTYNNEDMEIYRRNRITGTVEAWYGSLGKGSWAPRGMDSWILNRKARLEKRESAGLPAEN